MRLAPTAALFAFVGALLATGVAGAAVATKHIGANVVLSESVIVKPTLSHSVVTVVADGDAATTTNVDVADTNSVAASNDPSGHVLFVWLWLLPLSGIFCIVSCVVVIGVMNSRIAMNAARRGVKPKKVGFFV